MIYIDTWIWAVFCYICGWVGLLSIITYLIGFGLQRLAVRFPQNLKKKYNAKWAVVTGASSGIGKAITEKLAEQQVNVVLVAKDDDILTSTFAELQQKYPGIEFRKVGSNLADKNNSYMEGIVRATEDIEVQLLFNNAGYICTGLFAETEWERLRCNMECNAGCVIPITHHFLRKMLERKDRGLVTFTSSSSAYFPGPTATLYSPTKAFLTNFAATLAAEVHDAGIDVVVMHPSPVNTNFYKNEGPSLDSLNTAKKAATSPMHIADEIFASAGRLTHWDQGATSAAFRIINKIIDQQLLVEVITRFAFLNGDHKKLAKASVLRNKEKNI